MDPTTEGAGGRPPAGALLSEVTEEPVRVAELARMVRDPGAGAVATFDGAVRDHDSGRAVAGIMYSAHPSAGEVLATIARDVGTRQGLRALAVVHRVGELGVGDTALGVAVSAEHRDEAFEAVRDVVEQVKSRLPVWKQQVFADGTRQWSANA